MIKGCLTCLLNKAVLSEYVQQIIYRRVVHTIIIRVCLLINIRSLSTNKTNIFVLKIVFHTWHIAC